MWTICCMLLFTTAMFAYTERNLLQNSVTKEQLKEALVMNGAWVPYPAYSDREGWNSLLNDEDRQTLIKAGEKMLDYKWQVIRATDYLEYERSGERNIMQNPYEANRKAINVLMMAELAEGKGRFIDQLINGVFFSCEMTSWVLSAHLPRQSTKRSMPDWREQIIDLGSGNYGSILAWVYYFFHDTFDKADPVISLRLRHELQERILDPYMENDREWWMAFYWKPGEIINNWNPWCNSNVLQCYLLLENDRDKLTDAVWRTMQSVDKFINFVKSDGACEEGTSYWGHAAGKMYDYLQILSDGTNGKVSLFNNPMIRRMGEYISRSYVGDGWVVNFADASAKGGGDAPLIYRYGRAVGSEEMMQFAAYLLKGKRPTIPLGNDAFRTLQCVLLNKELEQTKPAHNVPACTWYPETEFCYLTNNSGWFLATKGGFNNESHNHNDAGTFSLYINNTPMLIDAGVGTYTRQTFSSERYSIWTMQSNYHNLPMINGVPQRFGQEYKATNVVCKEKQRFFSADISTAYPEEAAVNSWTRSYKLENKRLVITDKFSLKETKAANQVNFLVWGDIDISKAGEISIKVGDEHATLEYPTNFKATLETIELPDTRLSNVWGKQIYRIVLIDTQKKLEGNYKFIIK
ncbi:heparinase II/III-family protein [Bacteroides sp. ET336]|uniref:heparinase II/III family protein n=1 Tax=Bacteroides sp. ET336 TaxID=2972459 RepID=UPI0021ACFC66|nr:heparinase II/III-family protein [Bacteroides sp. ET336]MCR8894710.1 heparinase II/III-family protein [Bacteroides sp. ET336]MDN0059206.1 heparinase II/III-family protein [Bacteroides caecigallinarum]